jgi:hypothetical protein
MIRRNVWHGSGTQNAERLSEVDAAVLDEAINEFASESAH